LRLELNLAADLPRISTVEGQILRVLSNLLANAREAMPNDGLITVATETACVREPFGRYHPIQPGDYVRLSVTDTGAGIAAEVIDRVFDPFFSTKRSDQRRGSGLGLSIVLAIVGDHHGYVDVESRLGEGTTISVYLPLSAPIEDQPSPRRQARTSPPAPALGTE
jgi:two-component system, cell cycle sensor histidine kinase and response regulator CckA